MKVSRSLMSPFVGVFVDVFPLALDINAAIEQLSEHHSLRFM